MLYKIILAFAALVLILLPGLHAIQPQNATEDQQAGQDKKLCKIQEIQERPDGCPLPSDCSDIQDLGFKTNGVYTVYVGPLSKSVKVYCDLEHDGGGWLVFQRRIDGLTDFYRGWTDYTHGFGDLYGEFWLGNQYLHLITKQKPYRLRVNLEDFNDQEKYAEYSLFNVDGPFFKYKLEVGGYSGTAGDSFSINTGMKFTTRDQDNDAYSRNCASTFGGAWWYRACHSTNLNGRYLGGTHTSTSHGITWDTWLGNRYSLKRTVMKIRPHDCSDWF